MERNLFIKLEQWKNKKKRKPLIIQGARQVGKTWIMKEFGARYYKDTIYINFDNNGPLLQNFKAGWLFADTLFTLGDLRRVFKFWNCSAKLEYRLRGTISITCGIGR